MKCLKINIFLLILSVVLLSGITAYAQSITLPDELTSIENEAFMNCEYLDGDITLPKKVESVGEKAFMNCRRLTSVELGNNVKTVGENAFAGCYSLEKIIIRGYNTQLSENIIGEFYGYSTVTLYVIRNSKAEAYALAHNFPIEYIEYQYDPEIIPPEGKEFYEGEDPRYRFVSHGDGTVGLVSEESESGFLIIPSQTESGLKVTTIEDRAFECSEYTGTINIPDGIVKIGNYAFRQCINVTGELFVPSSVITIGNSAFEESGITSLNLSEGIRTIGESAFASCVNLTGSIVLPEGLTEIGRGVFFECSGFGGNLQLPSSLKEIPELAFCDCSSLTGDLILPEGLETIGEYAFWGCSGYSNGAISLPSTLKVIEEGAFLGAYFAGEQLILPDGLEKIISGIPGIFGGGLRIPGSVKEVGGWGGSSFTGELVIEDGVEIIRDRAFQYSSFTGDLHIPGSVKTIGDEAFQGCYFKRLFFEEGVERIGARAFNLASHPWSNMDLRDQYGYLECDLILPNSLREMGEEAFMGAYRRVSQDYSLEGEWNLRLSPNCPIIPYRAFYECERLSGQIIIPEGVKRIEDEAFEMTRFSGYVLVLPEGLEYLGSIPWCKELWLPSTLKEISNSALSNIASIYGIIVLADDESAISDYLLEKNINMRFTSSSIKAPEGTLYHGDTFKMMFDKLLLDKGYEEISAYILQNNEIIRSASYPLDYTLSDINAFISNNLKIETLPISDGYVFRLSATINGNTKILVETNFSIEAPPVRRWLRDLQTPNGIVTRDEAIVSGDIICNYPMSTIEVVIISSIGMQEMVHKYYNIPEENQMNVSLESIIEATLLNQLDNGKYYLRITATVPSHNISFYIVKDKVFWLVTMDGEVDEETMRAVMQYVTSDNNESIFLQYSQFLKLLIEDLDWQDILKMAYNGRWEIFNQYAFEGGSDTYMRKFCKAQVIATLDDVVHRQRYDYSLEHEKLMTDILNYVSKGKKIVSYVNNEGLFVGNNRMKISATDDKIFDFIDGLGDIANSLKDSIEYWEDYENGVHELMSYLAADYTVERAILDSVLETYQSSSKTAAVHAMQEIYAEYTDMFYYFIKEIADYMIEKGEEYIRKLAISKPLPLQVIVDFVGDTIMKITGWAEDAENDMNLLAWDQNCTACNNAYKDSFRQVRDGDTSGGAIRRLIMSFRIAKECFMNALEFTEDYYFERFGTNFEIIQLETKLEKVKIPGLS